MTFKVFNYTIKLFLKKKKNPNLSLLILFSLIGTKDDITDVKNRLKNADKKKKALEKDLLDAQNQLNNIKTGRTSQGISALA